MKRFLTIEEVADRYRCSVKVIHDKTRKNQIPHTKRTGFRRLLFDPDHLDAYDRGAQLRTKILVDGSKLVEPVGLIKEAA
jgi:excisionase family DNA binding protein